MPPTCELRAPIIRGAVAVVAVVQGMRGLVCGLQFPPVITSGEVLLGAM